MPAMAPRATGRNEYYKTDEEYIGRRRRAAARSTRRSSTPGFILQIDDPAFATDVRPRHGARGVAARERRAAVEALNYALQRHPAREVRFHTCYGINIGPRVHDAPLADFVDLMLQINAAGLLLRGGEPAPRARVARLGGRKLPDGKVIIPGVISHATDARRAPGAGSPTASATTPSSSAART